MQSHIHEMRFLSLTVCSLLNEMDELITITQSYCPLPSLIAVTETWCRPDDPNSLYAIPEYTLFCSDRQRCRGGGVHPVHSWVP